jgi:hypothetical protein
LSRLKNIAEGNEKFVCKVVNLGVSYNADKERYLIELSYRPFYLIIDNDLPQYAGGVRYFEISRTKAPEYRNKFRALYIGKTWSPAGIYLG